ncbi:MAG: septum formation initiator family protein [Candidatus Spechtbacterales bacterium]
MKDIFSNYIAPVILVALMVIIGAGVAKQVRQGYALYSDVKQMEEKIEDLETENEEIKNIIASFNDPGTIDREVRNRLNLKKEGENVVIILPPEKANIAKIEENDAKEDDVSLWQKVKSLFLRDR